MELSRSTVTVGATGYTPSAFESAARSFDRYISVRWGEKIHQWVIERRAYIPTTEKWFLTRREARLMRFSQEPKRSEKERASLLRSFQEVHEERVSAQKDRRVLLFARWLTTEIFDALVASDIKRYGGYSRYADELERREAAQETEDRRVVLSDNQSVHEEARQNVDFLLRKRSTSMFHGERSLTKLLAGRSE